MEYEVQKPLKVDDGAHTGVIVGVECRTEPYKYTDIIVEFEEGMRMKYGCPSFVSEESKLGKLLSMFGVVLKVGEKVNDSVLIGKKCIFMTLTEEKNGKKFAKVIEGSLKPFKGEEN